MHGQRAMVGCAFALLAAMGCGDGASAPTIHIADPRVEIGSSNVLSALLTFETERPAVPQVTILGPDGEARVPASGLLTPSPSTEHRVALVGLKAETSYGVRIAGARIVPDDSVRFTTPPLPRGFPGLDVRISRPSEMEPGVTVFPAVGLGGAWIVAIDALGDPIWYHRADPTLSAPAGVRPMSGGEIAFVETGWEAIQIVDVLEGTTRRILARDVGFDTFHHDVSEGPDGNLLVLSSELVPTDGFAEGSLDLVADVLIEMTRDGVVLDEWHLIDILAPHRILADAVIPFWQGNYPGRDRLRDWSHVNSFVYDPVDDGFLVGSLNQHLIFEIDRAGALRWVLGDDRAETAEDDAWPWLTKVGEGRFPVRQHGVSFGPRGTIMAYDNGFDTLVSRPIEIDVDEERREAEVVWGWVDPQQSPALFSPVGGDADAQPGGTVLLYHGVNLSLSGRLVEVRQDSGEKVFEVRIVPFGGGFSAARIPSLYPDRVSARR